MVLIQVPREVVTDFPQGGCEDFLRQHPVGSAQGTWAQGELRTRGDVIVLVTQKSLVCNNSEVQSVCSYKDQGEVTARLRERKGPSGRSCKGGSSSSRARSAGLAFPSAPPIKPKSGVGPALLSVLDQDDSEVGTPQMPWPL